MQKFSKKGRCEVESVEDCRWVEWSWTSPGEIEHFIGLFQFYTGCSLRLIQSLEMARNTLCFKLILILCLKEQKHNKPSRQFTFNNH